MEENKIIIYQTEDGQTQIDVRLENETVWLTQAQMAELFETDRTSIVRHINNIYKVEELYRESTCAKIAQVQIEGKRTVKRNIPYFNLDMIISVGYRVNSKRGVKFRQWANRVLKEYLIKGYAVNDRIRKEQIGELRQLVGMLGRTIQSKPLLSNDETNALFEVVTNYTYALDTLDNYDYERLTMGLKKYIYMNDQWFSKWSIPAMSSSVSLRTFFFGISFRRFNHSPIFPNERILLVIILHINVFGIFKYFG